jgi:trimeric autotransporter adhesin
MKRGLNKENSLPDPEFGGESSESARAIHYVVQKDTLMTYVSALIAQADPGIVSGSTIERKKMSTKTIYKRIALVAVAALGAGVLSVAPSNAATTAEANATTVVTAITLASATSSPQATKDVIVHVGATTVVAAASTQIAFKGVLTSFPAGGFVQVTSQATLGTGSTLGAVGTLIAGSAVATVSTASTIALGAEAGASNVLAGTVTASSTAGIGAFKFTPTVAGDYTLTVWNEALGGTNNIIDPMETRQTINITVAAAAATAGGASLFTVASGTTALGAGSASDTGITGSRTVGTQRAVASIIVRDSGGTAKNGQVLTASTTRGLVLADTSSSATAGTGRSSSVTLTGASLGYVHVSGDGTSGVGTVTVSVTDPVTGVTTVVRTFDVLFHGTVKSLVATRVYGNIPAGTTIGCNSQTCTGTAFSTGSTGSPAVRISALDDAGVLVPTGVTITGTSASAIIVSASAVGATATNADDAAGAGVYNANVTGASVAASGATTTVTYSTTDPVLATTIRSNAITFTIGGAVATETITFDKTSYAPGAPVTITRTAKDSAGNIPADGSTANAVTSPLQGTVGASWYVGGVRTNSAGLYAPYASGTVTATMLSGNALTPSAVVTGTTTVGSSAEIASLTTLINSLVAKMNALSKLVTKIQKKVKA